MIIDPTNDPLYANAPAGLVRALADFRAAHPYRTLEVGGVGWQYVAAGAGREAVLVLGGGLSTGEASFRTVERLAGRYRVLSPSYPPTGDVVLTCDGLVALLAAEGIAQAHVYGHSMGAAIAHLLVRRHPDRVGRLVLTGFGLYNQRNRRRGRLSLTTFRLMPYRFVTGRYRQRVPILLKDLPDPDERAFLTAYMDDLLLRQHTKRTLVGQMGILADLIERGEALGLLDPPPHPFWSADRVLIVQALDDRGFAHDEQALLRGTYPGARVHLFQTGGHWATTIHRAEFEPLFDAFLAGRPIEG